MPCVDPEQLRRDIQWVLSLPLSFFCFYEKGNRLASVKKERGNVRYLERMKPAVKSKLNRVLKDLYASITAAALSNSSVFISKVAERIGEEHRSIKNTTF